MSRLKRTPLFVRPVSRRYGGGDSAHGEQELAELLQTQRHTKPVPVTSVSDLLMNKEGRIQGKYRLTTAAMNQICSNAATSLGPLLLNIIGIKPRTRESELDDYSPQLAIKIFNDVIQLRFALFEKRGLVIDKKAGVVEGLVSSRYRFFSNYDFYSWAKSKAADKFELSEAVVSGRQVCLRFVGRKAAFAVPGRGGQPDLFHPGWYAVNSELADCSVRGSVLLFRRLSETSSMLPFTRSTRVVHFRGDPFERGMRRMFKTISRKTADLWQLKDSAVLLQEKAMPLTAIPEDYEKNLDKLQKALRKTNLLAKTAQLVTVNLLLNDSYSFGEKTRAALPTSPETLKMLDPDLQRSKFDFYNAIGQAAKSCSISQREYAEQAAYKLLSNQTYFD
jgi:hypothetical protein